MDASIIVCTYNRADSLRDTLKALSRQEFRSGRLEIVVVDNNSDDHTRSVVESMCGQSPVEMRYLFESEQGLSKARNAGIAAAIGDVVIFIDDDARPKCNDWADRLVSTFADAAVGAAGGDAVPVWPAAGRPPWLHNKLLAYLGIVTFAYSTVTDLHYPHYPYGVNISFRKKVFDKAGAFSTKIGRIGNRLLSGEEIDLCRRVEAQGYRVVYVPDAAVDHVMAPGRLTKDWFLNRARSQGMTKASIELPGATRGESLLKLLLRTIILVGSSAAFALLKSLRSDAAAFVSHCKAAMSLAYLRAALAEKD